MILFSLLPIIMIVVLLFGLTKIPNYVGGKVTKWLIAAYVVILLVSVVTYSLLPESTEGFEQMEEEMNPIEEMPIYDALYDGQLDQLNSFIQKQWSFDYDSSDHELIVNGNMDNLIYLLEKEKDDGVIDVTFYSTDFILNGKKIEDERFIPTIELYDNVLRISRIAEIEFVLAEEEQEFIISQFTEQPSSIFGGGFGTSYYYESAIVIEVPQNTEMDADSDYYIMIDHE